MSRDLFGREVGNGPVLPPEFLQLLQKELIGNNLAIAEKKVYGTIREVTDDGSLFPRFALDSGEVVEPGCTLHGRAVTWITRDGNRDYSFSTIMVENEQMTELLPRLLKRAEQESGI